MKKSLYGVLYLMCFGIVSIIVSTTAYATNGMNMEGYGPDRNRHGRRVHGL